MAPECMHHAKVEDCLRVLIDHPWQTRTKIVDCGEDALTIGRFTEFQSTSIRLGSEQASCDIKKLPIRRASFRRKG